MKGTDNEGIESFLDEIKEDIERDNTDKALNRMVWLRSQELVTGNRDLIVIEGILKVNIRRFRRIVDKLKSIMEKKEAEDLLGRPRDTLTDIIILSKDYLRNGDKTKFFDSIAQNYYTLQEINETLRLEEEEE
jgi:uncharacterized protein YpuA (DUF1002 family)